MGRVIQAEPVIPGVANGSALVSSEPLSFWGGYDQHTGEIIDRHHPLSGEIAAGRIMVLPHSRGSSTTTAVLLEALRTGTAPAALLSTGRDTFFALAAVVSNEMYGISLPVLALDVSTYNEFETGQILGIDPTGAISIE